MKRTVLFLLPLFCAACTSDLTEEVLIEQPVVKKGVAAVVEDFQFEETTETRTAIMPTSKGLSFAWKEGDQIGIYATSATASFSIDQIGIDAKNAMFDGGGFGLKQGSEYLALYPYMSEATNKSAVRLNYAGQRQIANNDTRHLSAFDYMTARATAVAEDAASFEFKHLDAIMRLKIALPTAGYYTKVQVTGAIFAETARVDLTSVTPSANRLSGLSKIALDLGNDVNGIYLSADDLTLTTYIAIAPVDLSRSELTVTVTDRKGTEYVAKVQGKMMEAGKAYAYNISHTYVNLGLPKGTLWATTNVGATRAADYGAYYAWGETEEKGLYNWSTYKYCNYSPEAINKYGAINTINKYAAEQQKEGVWSVVFDNLISLLPEDDAATTIWGNSWRTPSYAEMTELSENCYWEWTTAYNGTDVAGLIVYKAKDAADRGKKSFFNPTLAAQYTVEDTHIFLPAAGVKIDDTLKNAGKWCEYWTNALDVSYPYDSYSLFYKSENSHKENKGFELGYYYRSCGEPVRAVVK